MFCASFCFLYKNTYNQQQKLKNMFPKRFSAFFKVFISLIISSLLFFTISFSQEEVEQTATAEEEEVPPNREENEACFSCHGQETYELMNSDSTETITKRMCADNIISRESFYNSNHGSFVCIDCHLPGYETFPHSLDLRFEEIYACLDCHFEDPELGDLNMEKISEQYEESVHHAQLEDQFSCWDCHDAHSYKLFARNSDNIGEIVEYNNAICLDCHADISKFTMLTEREQPEILATHEWLPNQSLHFKKVRCIECHTQLSDSVLVAHTITPKEEAVKKCAECHTKDSRLMASLYKYQNIQARSESGFFNAVVLNDAYIIGANRNYFLNVISIGLFIFVVVAIIVHSILRKTAKNKKQ